jgi:hypothetical protein
MVFAFVIVGLYGTKVLELLRHTFFWHDLDDDYSILYFFIILNF